MISAAVVYIVVSVLLIMASSLIFFKALQSLKYQSSFQRSEIKLGTGDRTNLKNIFKNTEKNSELKNREEIVAQLERQFRSSPSADL
jgi:hypothetical protein